MLHQVEKCVEGLGVSATGSPSAEKQTFVRFQTEVSEFVDVCACWAHGDGGDLQIVSEAFRAILRTLQAQREEDERRGQVRIGRQFCGRGAKYMRSSIVKGLSVLMLGSVIMLASGASGSGAPPDKKPGLVGTWRVQVTLVDCQTGTPLSPAAFPSLLTFAFGGTTAEDTANPAFGPGQRGVGQGVWDYKGPRLVRVKSVAFINYTTAQSRGAHNPGFEAGEQTITQMITFKDGPNKWSSNAAIEFTDVNGVVYRQGCALATAQRF